MPPPLTDPSLYTNRELSWLAFNERVLALAERSDVPLLERLKFIAIAASNLDEFHMVRVGGLEHQLDNHESPFDPGPDQMSLRELLEKIRTATRALSGRLASVLHDTILPKLAEENILLVDRGSLSEDTSDFLRAYYQREVHPCLTPIGVDQAHPFPKLRNGTLNMVLRVVLDHTAERSGPAFPDSEGELLAIVQVPSVLPRFVELPSTEGSRFMALEQVIAEYVGDLFPGHVILESAPFRVMRSSDLDFVEDEAENLLSTIRTELLQRDRGVPVLLELADGTSDRLAETLTELIGLAPEQHLPVRGLVAPAALMSIYGKIDRPDLRDEPFSPVPIAELTYGPTMFQAINDGDILLSHPYDSFRHVVDFIDQAADDPDVVAIKQTLYRTSGDSPIVRALVRAAEAGKQVTALVELKARFDEANNIAWAQELEKSGAHVVYGLIGLKTHCKLLLVIRREGDKLKRYLHLSTGNYNPSTARLYTDIGLFTARKAVTHDAMMLFNILTGYADLPEMAKLRVAPFNLRETVIAHLEREAEHAKAGRPAHLVAKMNSLVDAEIIRHLYRASQAGVKIDLMIRGICCLRPGIPGISEHIRVRSILDRFLEHSRIFWWKNGGDDEVYLSSADWMPRNLNRRIEVSAPVLDEDLKARVTEEILNREWRDNTHAWNLNASGTYERIQNDAAPFRLQAELIAAARRNGGRAGLTPKSAKTLRINPAVRAALAQSRRRRTEST